MTALQPGNRVAVVRWSEHGTVLDVQSDRHGIFAVVKWDGGMVEEVDPENLVRV